MGIRTDKKNVIFEDVMNYTARIEKRVRGRREGGSRSMGRHGHGGVVIDDNGKREGGCYVPGIGGPLSVLKDILNDILVVVRKTHILYIYIYIYIYMCVCKSYKLLLPWRGGGGGEN